MLEVEKRAKSKVKGIVWRDGGWWYNRTAKGIRRWFNLETKDLSQAIERKHEVIESPSLPRHDSLEVDCRRFVNWKAARREYTSGSADKARRILKLGRRFKRFAPRTSRSGMMVCWRVVSGNRPLKATSANRRTSSSGLKAESHTSGEPRFPATPPLRGITNYH